MPTIDDVNFHSGDFGRNAAGPSISEGVPDVGIVEGASSIATSATSVRTL